ncbi:MAG: alpha-galactosidase, partial [Blautia sp.]|nr:alpha-galactosidase [Blautia sp.]
FSVTGLSPYLPGDCAGAIQVHRLQSRWSQEGRHLVQTLEELQLESSWNLDSVRCERYGQVGSLPVNRYFPFLALEDTKNHVFWGAQLAHPASWQMEIYRKDENIAFSGGLADREFGHWMKDLLPGGTFTTPEAILSTAHTDSFDLFTQRLVEAGEEAVNAAPASEQELPIIFNEYCTTWGCPSHENITGILKAIRDKGFSYFVIDCGWYKADGVPWDISMGDYVPSKTLFPEGLQKTVDAIHDAGLKAGIWFEIENVGHASEAFHYTEHLLKRDGYVLTGTRRRYWDMSDPWVKDYLRERVIGTLKTYGFEYMKIDYNDTIGIGCDGRESLGEGLRCNMQESMHFLEEVKREVPGIILENCASGGHRLEPGFMAAASMASFSDAHECVEIPIIAANLHWTILPRQSQIWAVIRETDDVKRIVYSVANTFLGRMCISGDVTNLSAEQWEAIERGIAFYRKIAPVIKKGQTYHLSPQIAQIRHPEGWQGIVRVGTEGSAYALIHTFGGEIGSEIPQEILLELPQGCPRTIAEVYSDTEPEVCVENGRLLYHPTDNWRALAVLLK